MIVIVIQAPNTLHLNSTRVLSAAPCPHMSWKSRHIFSALVYSSALALFCSFLFYSDSRVLDLDQVEKKIATMTERKRLYCRSVT